MTPFASGKRRGPTAVTVALLSACVWFLDLILLRGGTPHPLDDTWEYGLVARSLLAGHGFRTMMIHPPLWGLHDATFTVPMLVHGPVLPLLGAPLLAAFGEGAINNTAWLAAAFAVLAAVFTARVVSRGAGRPAGALAAALVTLSPILLRMVHHDIAPAAGACAVALAMDFIVRPTPRAFAAGITVGLGALVRPELLLLSPVAYLLLGPPRIAGFALGLALAIVPWAFHTFRATGSLAFNLSSYMLIAYTPAHPGLSPLWDFSIPLSRWIPTLISSLPALPGKWLHMAPRAIKHMLMSPSPGLGLVAGAGLLNVWSARLTRRLGWAAMAAALIPFVVCTTTESSERYVAVMLPVWAAGTAWGAMAVGQGLARSRQIAAVLLVVMLPFTVRAWIIEAHQAAALRTWLTQERQALASRTATPTAGRVLFSDTPDFVAWTTRRPTVATTLEAYRSLPDTLAAGASIPSRSSDPLDEWFHADVRALPAPALGGPAR